MPERRKTHAAAARTRDREATERAIVTAAKTVLAEDGFQTFGVNAIARRAGCDKQLIYRYFGGLEGLCDAIGADLATELTARLGSVTAEAPRSYGALMRQLALDLLELQRNDRLMQQINAWEAAAPSPLVARLTAARGLRMMKWMGALRGDLKPPPGVDAPAMNAIVVAAIQQLVVSATANGSFSGMPLATEAHWSRLRDALIALTQAVYGD